MVEEVSDFVHPGAPRLARVFAWVTIFIIFGTMAAMILAFVINPEDDKGDPGELSEQVVPRPTDVPLPALVDTTVGWGLDGWITEGENPLRGGATLHDLDGDGDLDLLVAGGALGLYEWVGDRFEGSPELDVGDAVSVHAGDIDRDGVVDVVVGRSDGATVLWGEQWFAGLVPEVTELPVEGLVTGAIPVDLDARGVPQVLVLGYGTGEATPDVLMSFVGRDVASVDSLPGSERKSMVAGIADLDDDGLADIWIGRDVGWAAGPDSIYSRQGEPQGPWVDVAASLGAQLEVDAMGLTIADLTGDGRLDAYVSDLGDNELLVRGSTGFAKRIDVGAARIRSATAEDNEISSSWGSGAADLNLDGRVDLVVANGGFDEVSVRNKVVNTFILEQDPPAVLLSTGTGSYVDVWPELELSWLGRSRGLSLGDIDNDGDTDLVVVDHGGGLHSYRNDTSTDGVVIRANPGCLASGATYRTLGAAQAWAVPIQQLSFLGSHAPEITTPAEVRVVDDDGIELTRGRECD